MISMPSYCKIIVPFKDAKELSVTKGIKIAMDRTRATNNEHLFTYSTKTGKLTSAIAEGDCGRVGTPQFVYGSMGGTSFDATFHTHPVISPSAPIVSCGFSMQDVVTDFIDGRRVEAKVGCPLTKQIATLRLNVPDFMRVLLEGIRNEMEVQGLLEGSNSYNFLAMILARALPEHKDLIEQIRVQNFDKMPGERKATRLLAEHADITKRMEDALPIKLEPE